MARYDWNYYRQRYVAADVTLADLAALPNAPKLDTLKKRSAREDWTGQREAFRHQASTKTRELASTTEAEIAARHARIAKALQHKALERLQTLTIADLNARDVLAYLKDAAEIERKALGLDSLRVFHFDKPVSSMTDEELEEAARELGVRED